MNKSLKIIIGSIASIMITIGVFGFKKTPPTQVSFKCLIQLTNYAGEGAYVVVSLIDSKGKYKKTIQVFGKEKRWWDDLPTWFKHLTSSKENVDGISGASIIAGNRKVFTINTDDSVFDKGYKLRFETAVENKEYYEKDVEMDFSEANVGKTINGSGYIRYVKLLKNP